MNVTQQDDESVECLAQDFQIVSSAPSGTRKGAITHKKILLIIPPFLQTIVFSSSFISKNEQIQTETKIKHM